MTRKFTFIKQETVEYEIEVEAENYKEALEEYEKGGYSNEKERSECYSYFA